MTELFELLLNPAHWGFELISGAVIGVLSYPITRRLLRRHDQNHHLPPQVTFKMSPVVVSQLIQRIERLEAHEKNPFAPKGRPWDEAGEAGL